MSTNEEIPDGNESTKGIKYLTTLLDYLGEVKERHEKGELSLFNIDIGEYFINLRKFIAPSTVDPSVKAMDGGTSLLERKIHELENLILFLDSREQIYQFITRVNNEEVLADLIRRSLTEPFNPPALASHFLLKSFRKLAERKILPILEDSFAEIPGEYGGIQEADMPDENIEELTFNENMMNYFNSIQERLPASIYDILENEDEDEAFAHFIYILHLIQKGYVNFDPERVEVLLPQDEEDPQKV